MWLQKLSITTAVHMSTQMGRDGICKSHPPSDHTRPLYKLWRHLVLAKLKASGKKWKNCTISLRNRGKEVETRKRQFASGKSTRVATWAFMQYMQPNFKHPQAHPTWHTWARALARSDRARTPTNTSPLPTQNRGENGADPLQCSQD